MKAAYIPTAYVQYLEYAVCTVYFFSRCHVKKYPLFYVR